MLLIKYLFQTFFLGFTGVDRVLLVLHVPMLFMVLRYWLASEVS